MKRSAVCLFALACIVLLFVSFAFAANTIKVGFVDALSGPAGYWGNDELDGFKMVVNSVNASGGVLGRKIEYVTRDDKWTPALSLAMAKELVMREKVDMLIGTSGSASALAVSDFAKTEKIPVFVYAKSAKISGEKGHRYVFAMSENSEMAGRGAAAVLAKKPYVKYWIAGDDYEFGHTLTESVWNHLKALNGKAQLLGQTWWRMGETDFIPYITAIMSAKPDFLIMGSGGSGIIGFQKAAKATGMNDKIPFYQHTAIDYTLLAPLGPDGPEGVVGTASYLFYYPQTPENKAFVDEFKKNYNRYPAMPGFFGYITAQYIVRAYQKAGTFDKEKFIDALEGQVLEKSPVGNLELRACDHQVLFPTYYGVTKKVPEYKDFLIGTDIITVPPKDGAPSCAEIQKARAQAK
ncbi:MAG TPA: ABC transporter substrate-binding protein [Syntrophorhabdales bacterium]|nr:ABC transporter substrate-binding protein [Syntrophorhabdales bacterium]